jgi:hypothetical protein
MTVPDSALELMKIPVHDAKVPALGPTGDVPLSPDHANTFPPAVQRMKIQDCSLSLAWTTSIHRKEGEMYSYLEWQLNADPTSTTLLKTPLPSTERILKTRGQVRDKGKAVLARGEARHYS